MRNLPLLGSAILLAAAPVGAQAIDQDLVDCLVTHNIAVAAPSDAFDGGADAYTLALRETQDGIVQLVWVMAQATQCTIDPTGMLETGDATYTRLTAEITAAANAGQSQGEAFAPVVSRAAACREAIPADQIAQLPEDYRTTLPCGWGG